MLSAAAWDRKRRIPQSLGTEEPHGPATTPCYPRASAARQLTKHFCSCENTKQLLSSTLGRRQQPPLHSLSSAALGSLQTYPAVAFHVPVTPVRESKGRESCTAVQKGMRIIHCRTRKDNIYIINIFRNTMIPLSSKFWNG